MTALIRHVAPIIAAATAFAQPPVGPDQRPETISPDELNRAIGGPTLVTLSFDNARPEEVARALVSQAGIALDGYASTDLLKKMPPISFSAADQAFTATLAALARQLDVSFTLKTPGGFDKPPSGMTLQLQKSEDPQMKMAGPMVTRGPFVIIGTALERRKLTALPQASHGQIAPVAREEATLDFVVLGDPKLRQHGVHGAPTFPSGSAWRIRPAENEPPWDARARNQGPPFLEWRYRATCELTTAATQTPPFAATASEILVATKAEPWEIEDPLKATGAFKEVRIGQGTRRYEVKQIGPAARGRQQAYDVVLAISGIGIDKGRWSGWPTLPAGVVVDSFRLLDSNGTDYAPVSWEMKGGTFTATFDNSRGRGAGKVAEGTLTKAVWTLPTELRTVEIPVDLPSLPLP